jgi:hypothetical protein
LIPATASATNYYVKAGEPDNATCEAGKPCPKIQTAADKVQPGDEVFVETGTYLETVKISKSGEEGFAHLIVFFTSNGETATVEGYEVTGSYVVLEKQVLRGSGGTCFTVGAGVRGVHLNGSTLIGCGVQNKAGSGLTIDSAPKYTGSKTPNGPGTRPKIGAKKCAASKTRKGHGKHKARTCAKPKRKVKHKPSHAHTH